MPEPDLVSTSEAAKLIGTSVGTVNRMARTGRLAVVVQAGSRGARFFHRSDVTAAAAARREAILATLVPVGPTTGSDQ